MIDKPKIIEGDGVKIMVSSDSKNLFSRIVQTGSQMFDMKANKVISKAIPYSKTNDAYNAFFASENIYRCIIANSMRYCKYLTGKNITEEDATARKVNDYVSVTHYANKDKTETGFMCGSPNCGYNLKMDWLIKLLGSHGVDIKKDVEKLFGMVKSYWNLKASGEKSTGGAIGKLEKDIEELDKKLDDARILVWNSINQQMDKTSDKAFFYMINPLNPKYREIIFWNDPWIMFTNGFGVYTFQNNVFDTLVRFDLGSLYDDETRLALGKAVFPMSIYTFFKVDSKFLGGVKFTRPDGETF